MTALGSAEDAGAAGATADEPCGALCATYPADAIKHVTAKHITV
jgi:hypothetical protein